MNEGLPADVLSRGESKEGVSQHIDVLTEKLKEGTTDNFDSRLIALLRDIEGNENKSALLRTLARSGLNIGAFIGSKAAGVMAGMKVGEWGESYTTEAARGYLSDRFLITLEKLKGVPPEAPKNPGWLEKLGMKVQGIVDSTINQGAETMNTYVIEPGIDATSKTAGAVSYAPWAVGGYLVGSALVGGTMGVIQEIQKEHSFVLIDGLVKRIRNAGESLKEKEDACRELIALFDKVAGYVVEENIAKEKFTYSFTRDEWLTFAGAVRQAKAFILKQKTAAPQIIGNEEVKKGMEHQAEVVNGIIEGQKGLVEADQALALEIINQFDGQLNEEIDPLIQRNLRRDEMTPRLLRYSKVFVKKGFDATGLPLVWKGIKIPFKVAGYALKKAVPFV